MDVDAYTETHTTPVPDFMAALADETRATQDSPQMLTGTVAGRFLEMLVWASSARRVLEIGTYTGYSALAMAQALPQGARIVSCELDPDRAAFARSHIEAAGYGDAVEIRVGPALDTIATLDGPFDLVFIDADKAGYPAYFEAALPLLSERGLIVLDNMLYGGDVLDGAENAAEGNARVLAQLNDKLAADARVVAVLLPIRDGMTVVRRAG